MPSQRITMRKIREVLRLLFECKLSLDAIARTPDQGGYSWWLNELNTNTAKTKAKVLADFAESQENKDSVASLIGTGIQHTEFVG